MVAQRLTAFKKDNSDWESFGIAGHSIGDFYAHSSYLHFVQLQKPEADDGAAPNYQPGVALPGMPTYTAAVPGNLHALNRLLAIALKTTMLEHYMATRKSSGSSKASWREANRTELLKAGMPEVLVDNEYRWANTLFQGFDSASDWSPAKITKAQARALLALLMSHYTETVGMELLNALEKRIK